MEQVKSAHEIAMEECIRLGGYTCLSCNKSIGSGEDHQCQVALDRFSPKKREKRTKRDETFNVGTQELNMKEFE